MCVHVWAELAEPIEEDGEILTLVCVECGARKED